MATDKKTIAAYNKHFKNWMGEAGRAHSHLEKPAMYKILPNIKNKKVLCIGCGAGQECAHFKAKGAKEVIGIDLSKGMITAAKTQYPELEFKVMDMEKLQFKNNTFDIVYSSLALHYVKDWTKVLNQVKKVLKPKGIFQFSTHDPVFWSSKPEIHKDGEKYFLLGHSKHKKTGKRTLYGDYLKIRKIHDVWGDDDNPMHIYYYNKPFSQMIKEIVKSGFKILDCEEPKSIPKTKKDYPSWYKAREKIPIFIIFKLQK